MMPFYHKMVDWY